MGKNNSNKGEELSGKIRLLLEKFEEESDGMIKQAKLAELLKTSESSLSRAKSPVYNTRINTLNRLNSDLENLYIEFEKDQKAFIESLDGKPKKNKKKFFLIVGAIALIIIILLLFSNGDILHNSSEVTTFTEGFDKKNLIPYLSDQGWGVDNSDSNFLFLQDSGAFTVYTLRGDMGGDFIKNLLVKKINCNKCIVETKIFDFNPTLPWQQAGIFLFDEVENTFDKNNFLRYTFAFGGENTVSKEDKWWHILQSYAVKDGIVIDNGERKEQGINYNIRKDHRPVDSLWLKIVVNEDTFSLLYKKNHSYKGFVSMTEGEYTLPGFQPKYIGIAGFHGVSWGNGALLPLDTISAKFDYIKIGRLEK